MGRSRARIAAAIVVLALSAVGAPVTGAMPKVTAVVPAAQAAAVAAAGVEVVERLDAIGSLVVEASPSQLAALTGQGVPVAVDRAMQPTGFEPGAVAAANPLGELRLPPGQAADRGAGVGIALLDSGVDARARLGGEVATGVDVTGAGNARRDGYGHGTFLAGLILGVDAPNGWDDVVGVAPGAVVSSVRVADDDGSTSLVRLLTGIEWTLDNADTMGIRVLLLAFGAPPVAGGPDPLHAALELAWASGIVVVVPSGNAGPGLVTSPGDDPWLLSVGASDGGVAASWSGRGGGRPDVLAPGAGLVSSGVPGSTLEREHRDALVGPHLLRGSGTSMSSALTAGASAIIIDAHPAATPDDIKGALQSTSAVAGAAGALDVAAAAAAPWSPAWVQRHPVDALLGTGDAMPWTAAPAGTSWTGTSWTGTSWTGTSWTGTSWTGTSWTGTSWTGTSWTGTSWTGTSWTGTSWTARW